MSWHRAYNSRREFEQDIGRGSDQGETGPEDKGVKEQRAAAREAAKAILDSDAVGGDEYDYVINLSGHSNPDHKPREGWAKDGITVNVVQRSKDSSLRDQ